MLNLTQLTNRERGVYLRLRRRVFEQFGISDKTNASELITVILSKLNNPRFIERTRVDRILRLVRLAGIHIDNTTDGHVRIKVLFEAATRLAAERTMCLN